MEVEAALMARLRRVCFAPPCSTHFTLLALFTPFTPFTLSQDHARDTIADMKPAELARFQVGSQGFAELRVLGSAGWGSGADPKARACFQVGGSPPLSFSLSLTHTHTHTHIPLPHRRVLWQWGATVCSKSWSWDCSLREPKGLKEPAQPGA